MAYIGCVVVLAVVLLGLAWRSSGLEVGVGLWTFVVLVVALSFVPDAVVEGRTRLSLSSILLLACQAIVGPAGAGVLGALVGVLQGRSLPARYRTFNAAQDSIMGTLGGLTFVALGGDTGARTAWSAVREIGLPLFAADVVQFVGNVLLLTGAVLVSRNGTLRGVIVPLVRTTGASYIGYGVIAFLMVVLWLPAGLGPVAALLVLAPLLVAQWAYHQHAEEIRGQDRVLEVLVAAVEAKAPHLSGHSGRVSALSARVAEELGFGPQAVVDVRAAGMLHDVGQTSLPTTVVRQAEVDDPAIGDYPSRGAGILGGLGFLRGALEPIAEHRAALSRPPSEAVDALPALVVGLVDRYDLLTEVGTPDGTRLGHDEAMSDLRRRPGVDDRLLHALESAVGRVV